LEDVSEVDNSRDFNSKEYASLSLILNFDGCKLLIIALIEELKVCNADFECSY
jgi:hypothetical protein